ncbi:MAG: DNA polymerase III subunit chi [Pseudomonadales bacterium]|nr:DNA polymerase III subunit chi [Pseudomonadales bacterium]MBL4794831.1 DNA polymerase III subunit chi [Pseudomonadales bacterium]
MTRVDFYILPDQSPQARLPFACRLVEKAYRMGHKIFILASEEDAHQLDELLWQQKPDSFLPHNILGEGPNAPPPIQIGYGQDAGNHRDVLINLTEKVPEYFGRFNRVTEIVPQDDAIKQASRINFKFYREKGCTVNSHDLTKGK